MCTVTIGTSRFNVDFQLGHVISIPLDFHGLQANCYDAEHASARAFQSGDFIGDTRQEGSCNCEMIRLTPHCNGTHTECIGHLTNERISIDRVLGTSLLPATLISVPVLPAASSAEQCLPLARESDLLITREALRQSLLGSTEHFLKALVIRTLPNTEDKLIKCYTASSAPYLTLEAMEEILDHDIQHLLVDIPSLDRLDDDGKMTAHRLFWSIPPGRHEAGDAAAHTRTITELIYVPDTIPDGRYMLNLQIAPFISDAAPSRPVLYPVTTRP